MTFKGLTHLTSKPQTHMHVHAALHMCIGPDRDGLPGAAFPSTTCGVITPHVKKSSPRFGCCNAEPASASSERKTRALVQVRRPLATLHPSSPALHSPLQPRALPIAPTLPASLQHPCPPCALHCALQQAAAPMSESSDHLGFHCVLFAGATAATATYVSAMPTQIETPLPHRHAPSTPVFTMHTARATLRGHTRRTSGL